MPLTLYNLPVTFENNFDIGSIMPRLDRNLVYKIKGNNEGRSTVAQTINAFSAWFMYTCGCATMATSKQNIESDNNTEYITFKFICALRLTRVKVFTIIKYV